MVSTRQIRDSNKKITSHDVPRVAVFAGGTSGIGRATLSLLVSKGTAITVYVIGRNKAGMEPFLEQLRKSNDKAEIIGLEGQVSLLADAKRLCDEIKSREKSLDLLFFSVGALPLGGRQETSEGVESSLSLVYYTRTLFTLCLLPLLNASINHPRVVSIFAAGEESSSIYLDDLQLAQPGHFSLSNWTAAGATYNTITLSKLAERNPGVIFIHNHPGLVQTELMKKGLAEKWYASLVGVVMSAVMVFIAHSVQDSGERCLYLITSAKYGGKGVSLRNGEEAGMSVNNTESSGLFDVGQKFDVIPLNKVIEGLKDKNAQKIVWEETLKVLKPYLPGDIVLY